jgi:mannose-6-phosphate isomerase-like protein (cupin superfamily)
MTMRPRLRSLAWLSAGLLAGLAAGLALPIVRGQVPAKPAGPLRSARVTWAEAPATKADWGELRAHFEGETYGLGGALAAMAVIKPGEQNHPPHQHSDEELLFVTEGSGRWHLDGKEFSAAKGDAIYAAPWVMHGIKNTSGGPLTWVVFKWNSKGVKAPEAPKKD